MWQSPEQRTNGTTPHRVIPRRAPSVFARSASDVAISRAADKRYYSAPRHPEEGGKPDVGIFSSATDRENDSPIKRLPRI